MRRILFVVSMFAVSPLGCAVSMEGGDSPPEAQEMAATIAPKVCVPTRYVEMAGYGGGCERPEVPATGGKFKREWLSQFNVTGLRHLCAYDWVPAAPGLPPTLPDMGQPNSKKPARGPDCAVVAPMAPAGTVEHKVAESLHMQWRRQAGAPYRMPMVVPGREEALDDVMVAVVDTTPTNWDGWTRMSVKEGLSGHGYSILRLIENVGCPKSESGVVSGPCLPEPDSFLAMPYTSLEEEDPENGGYYGTYWTLARAITRAADTFLRQASTGKKKRLIVNLSLAWDRSYGGYLPAEFVEDLEPGHEAVARALQYVGCLGGLVFDAVGNFPGGAGSADDALYPAEWATRMGLAGDTCRTFLGPAVGMAEEAQLIPDEPAQLVYAVGGVDGSDQPLFNGRNIEPAMVAPAELVTARVPGADYTRTGTGSSYAAALASAAARVAWTFNPSLSRKQVIEAVHDGVDYARTATLPNPAGGADPVRRISVCRTLKRACGMPGDICQSVPACSEPAYLAGKPTMLSSTTLDHVAGLGAWSDAPLSGDTPLSPAPMDTLACYASAPPAGPQPESTPKCSYCLVEIGELDTRFRFELVSLRDAVYTEPHLVLFTASGASESRSLEDAVDNVETGVAYSIDSLEFSGGDYTSAVLSLKLGGTGGIRSMSVNVPIPLGYRTTTR